MQILFDQLAAVLRDRLTEIRQHLERGDLARAQQQLRVLVDRARWGRHLCQGWRVVLAGPPNVGKSSLMNRMVGYDRSIVYRQPGTTRDAISANTAIDGWPVELVDTAGIRATDDEIEHAGIQMTERQSHQADLVLIVIDAGAFERGTVQEQQQTTQWLTTQQAQCPQAVCVLNKIDLLEQPGVASPLAPLVGPDAVCTSAVTGQGVAELLQLIAHRLVPNPAPPGDAVPFTLRQQQAMEEILATTDCQQALLTVESLLRQEEKRDSSGA